MGRGSFLSLSLIHISNKIIRKADLTPEKKAEYIEMIGEWLSRKNIGALHAEPHYKLSLIHI